MKFILELEVADNDVLVIVNDNLEWEDKDQVETLGELTDEEILNTLGVDTLLDNIFYISDLEPENFKIIR